MEFAPQASSLKACLKVDLRKAYDSLDRNFLCCLMTKMGFNSTWMTWIRSCLESLVLVNGSPAGYFHSLNGLSQGEGPVFFFFHCFYLKSKNHHQQ